MSIPELEPLDWFQEAQRWYLEKHQGCPWCGESHRVYFLQEKGQTVYYCQGCDFQVRQDESTGKCYFIPGEDVKAEVPDTMYAQE